MTGILRRRLLAAPALLLIPRLARAGGEVRVMTSGGLTAAYRDLLPEMERRLGLAFVTVQGASMGAAPDAIPQRLARGEEADVLLLAAEAADALAAQGHAAAGTRVDLARSVIGAAVQDGAPRPDISTVEGLRRALLDARSIAYSASASGVFIEREMFRRLGIHEEVMPRARRIYSERVGSVVARGEAEIGFQQVSELLPIPGLAFLGPVPEEVQLATVFSAALAARARNPEGARATIAFLASAEAAPALRRTGLEPLSGRTRP